MKKCFDNTNMKVRLRAITEKDTANILKWRNSTDVRKNLFGQADLTESEHIEWLDKKIKTGLCFQYIIEITDDTNKIDIGTVLLKRKETDLSEGEFGMFIGNTNYRGKHLATIATLSFLDICFGKYKMNRIHFFVFEDNTAAIKAYMRAGVELSKRIGPVINGKQVLLMEISQKMWNLQKVHRAVSL